jgi:hypothetical protein
LPEQLTAAVVTEWHPFNVKDFQRSFTTFADFDIYMQSLELLATDEENQRTYNVVVFYNLSNPRGMTTSAEGATWSAALEAPTKA